MTPRRGDTVRYDRPPRPGTVPNYADRLWQARRDGDSLVVAVTGGTVHCHLDGTAPQDLWGADAGSVRVVARPAYYLAQTAGARVSVLLDGLRSVAGGAGGGGTNTLAESAAELGIDVAVLDPSGLYGGPT